MVIQQICSPIPISMEIHGVHVPTYMYCVKSLRQNHRNLQPCKLTWLKDTFWLKNWELGLLFFTSTEVVTSKTQNVLNLIYSLCLEHCTFSHIHRLHALPGHLQHTRPVSSGSVFHQADNVINDSNPVALLSLRWVLAIINGSLRYARISVRVNHHFLSMLKLLSARGVGWMDV